MSGYNIYRNDREGKGSGGVLLAVKQYIKSREIRSFLRQYMYHQLEKLIPIYSMNYMTKTTTV